MDYRATFFSEKFLIDFYIKSDIFKIINNVLGIKSFRHIFRHKIKINEQNERFLSNKYTKYRIF